MSVAEAEVRMTALRAREKVYDLKHWMDSFFSQLLNSPIVDSEAIGVILHLNFLQIVGRPCNFI